MKGTLLLLIFSCLSCVVSSQDWNTISLYVEIPSYVDVKSSAPREYYYGKRFYQQFHSGKDKDGKIDELHIGGFSDKGEPVGEFLTLSLRNNRKWRLTSDNKYVTIISPFNTQIDLQSPPKRLYGKRFFQQIYDYEGANIHAFIFGGFSKEGKPHGEFLYLMIRPIVRGTWMLSGVKTYSNGVPDGYWCYAGDGMGYYKDGIKNGVWCFDTTTDTGGGDVQYIEFCNGVRHGSYKCVNEYETMTGNYDHEKKSGLWVSDWHYRYDLRIITKEHYENDLLHGDYEEIRNGLNRTTGQYLNGEKHGEWVFYWKEGAGWMELWREIYRNGKLIETIKKEYGIIELEVTEGIIK